MIKRLAVVASLIGLALPFAPGAAQAGDYVAQMQTSCQVSTPEVIERGAGFTARVSVGANSPQRPRGEITVRVVRERDAQQVWSTSRDFSGRVLTVQGPRLAQPGAYDVRVTFVPADRSVFRGCSASAGLDVSNGLDPDDRDDRDDDGAQPEDGGGGLLPDTGGPDFWLMLLALGLITAGSTMVVVSRRQRPVPSLS